MLFMTALRLRLAPSPEALEIGSAIADNSQFLNFFPTVLTVATIARDNHPKPTEYHAAAEYWVSIPD
jgi:hypothetical protein